jgi:cytochrome c
MVGGKVMHRNPQTRLLLTYLLVAYPFHPAFAGDPVNGEKVFAPCKPCHQIGETAKNSTGPVLNGVMGRSAGVYAGFNYSPANKESGLTWDEPTFREFMKDPKSKLPGSKMTSPGVKDDQKIDDLIAYLKQFGPEGKINQQP